ncbi:hypothetical protein AAMO2058_000458800 [Amorphochlora amoebiformis]
MVESRWAPLFDPYILINTIVCLSYVPVRLSFDEGSQLFKSDPMGITREMQIAGVMVLGSWVKYRRANSWQEFAPSIFMYSKVVIFLCCMVANKTYAAWYAVIFLVLFFALHESEDKSPNNVVALNTANFYEVEGDMDAIWLVEFYTTWAKHCIPFTKIFNRLSNKYGSDKIKFAKVDIGRFKSLATKFNISLNVFNNNELPTIILFHKGKPVPNQRLPVVKKDGSLNERFVLLTEENVEKYFGLAWRTAEHKKQSRSGNNKKAKRKKVRS